MGTARTGTEPWVYTHSAEETRAFARRFARTLRPGTVLALHGELGAGKTCFVQGLAEGLEVKGIVTSPTYILVHEHEGRLPLYHVDFYRLGSVDEVQDLGFAELMESGGVVAVEWPDCAAPLLPAHTIHLYLESGEDPDTRRIRVESAGAPC